ncbi:10 TM acyl transferase domain found in Cas1p-domain-containing protein [Flammula alnicola]|nr:10 TM acyl transferase domain found in Cas1p-domain-containing protein [Flammula alnicola]
MDYTQHPSDEKHNPYIMEYTPERSSTSYPPTAVGSSSGNTLSQYPDEKKNGYTMEYDPDESYDPTNVGQPREQYALDAPRDHSAAPFGHETSAYSEDDLNKPFPEHVEDSAETPLVRGPTESRKIHFQDLEYADPTNAQAIPPNTKEKPGLFSGAKYPLAQRIEDKKRGIGRQKYPIVVYCLTAAMVGVFIYELVLNARQQGTPISLKPTINPMLGPSSSALVNLGARFPPCMKLVSQVPPSTLIGCMNNTANPVTEICTVEDLCGFGGFHGGTPNQWFRFITAIFLHAGFIHILINMFAQLTLSAQIEREMGSGGFLITYFAAGIFGRVVLHYQLLLNIYTHCSNVLGGNFSLVGVPSVGASGAIFGTVAVTWVDLFAHWKYQYRPVRKLIFMTIELIVGFALGYIPSHLGGFTMGLLVGTVFYPVISVTKRHRLIMWAFRLAAIPLAVLLFVVLLVLDADIFLASHHRQIITAKEPGCQAQAVLLFNYPRAHLTGWSPNLIWRMHQGTVIYENSKSELIVNRAPNAAAALANPYFTLSISPPVNARFNLPSRPVMPRLFKSSLNPAWPHFFGVFPSRWWDPIRCRALLNHGSWLDSNHQNWQPEGCADTGCIFAWSTIDDTKKHADHILRTKYGTNITFAWDPFLNSSYTEWALTEARSNAFIRTKPSPPPAMLVLGSGLWYLRYANSSGGMSAWESKMEHVFESLATYNPPADEVVILPIGQVIPSKLSADRALTMHPSDVDAMNSDLYHRINPPSDDFRHIFSKSPSPQAVSLPLVFNTMLDESMSEDGLHYSDALVKLQARILLNLRCNDVMPKSISGAVAFADNVSWNGFGGLTATLLGKQALSPLIISLAIALIFTADRTGFWLKEQKQFDAWIFGSLGFLSLMIGLVTVNWGETDMGFLNRDQTNEWKGWMQIAILLYHYFGGSKISGIYNPIRVLVASYLFMTGYGHTTFYLRKADYGFLRIAQVLIRLNLFTILLAFTMNTDYISYYFTPLVSMWYLVVYLTMGIGARFNDRTPIVIVKILLSAGLMTWFMNESWLLEALFDALHRFCAIHWSSREWAFRVNLDIWMVYVGMLTSIAVIKIREHRLTDHPRWPIIIKLSIALSALAMVWFFAFELFQESKFTYNKWHPYISFLPVLAFAILRNSNALLRSAYSEAFAFVGKCSLETFIIQYHFWLAGDSKGVLLVVLGTRWRPVNFLITTTMFFYLCDRVAYATGDITMTICATRTRGLPPPVTEVNIPEGQEISISLTSLRVEGVLKDDAGHPLPIEPDTPIRPNRWVDRLAEGPSPPSSQRGLYRWVSSWLSRLHARVFVFLGILWLFNIFWPYPSGVAS